ncbi:hypothetical protein B0H16DRAFT_1561117 [Mycena metata]|uniref:Uncharacterized protein n=1 Tax=Mycena metata TaxID=1033252 RepID=A0AAD7N342_9AGAR|nr:hypothetical protein B0H16DRAFT_1561117 [Mycena metata]
MRRPRPGVKRTRRRRRTRNLVDAPPRAQTREGVRELARFRRSGLRHEGVQDKLRFLRAASRGRRGGRGGRGAHARGGSAAERRVRVGGVRGRGCGGDGGKLVGVCGRGGGSGSGSGSSSGGGLTAGDGDHFFLFHLPLHHRLLLYGRLDGSNTRARRRGEVRIVRKRARGGVVRRGGGGGRKVGREGGTRVARGAGAGVRARAEVLAHGASAAVSVERRGREAVGCWRFTRFRQIRRDDGRQIILRSSKQTRLRLGFCVLIPLIRRENDAVAWITTRDVGSRGRRHGGHGRSLGWAGGGVRGSHGTCREVEGKVGKMAGGRV